MDDKLRLTFREIYEKKKWQVGPKGVRKESVSGIGSEVHNTENLRSELTHIDADVSTNR